MMRTQKWMTIFMLMTLTMLMTASVFAEEQGKINILGIAIQTVENPQGSAAVESGPLEKLAPPQTEQGDLLEDLPQCLPVILQAPA